MPRFKLTDLLARAHPQALLAGLLMLLLAGCEGPGPGESVPEAPVDDRLSVFAVNYPLAWFAEQIGRDAVRVSLPVPQGVDPATWQPPAESILEFQQADLILLNGAGYAAWVENAALPNNRLVDTTRSFRDRLIRLDSLTHSHGPDGDHSHDATASETWLDPQLALEQARAILDALVTYRPEQAAELQSHFSVLERELLDLDTEMAAAFAALEDEGLIFSRNIYQYLQRRFSPNARNLDWQPETIPDEAALAELRALLAEQPAGLLVWDREPYAVTVELLEAEGVRSIAFSPVANRPAEGNYLDLMAWNLANLARVVPPAPPAGEPAAD